MGHEYVFVDEWDVDAPPADVFQAVADARTYHEWWRPVYSQPVEGSGPPEVGQTSLHRFKGRLPYTLEMNARMTSFDPPRSFDVSVDGDLRGTGRWTFEPRNGGTHVRWDWVVFADRPLLRRLTPVLRPLFRWNHSWAVARAREGLEPYARSRAGL